MSATYSQKPYTVGLKCLNIFFLACLLFYTKHIFLKYRYNQISSFLKNVLGTLMPQNKVPTVYDIYSPLHPAPTVPFPHCFSDPSLNIFRSQVSVYTTAWKVGPRNPLPLCSSTQMSFLLSPLQSPKAGSFSAHSVNNCPYSFYI